MSRSPDERLYGSNTNDSFAFTQCYVSFGDTDGEDFAFTKCNADGTFSLSGLPDGTWRVTVFDQWNDMLVDGLSTPVALSGGHDANMGQIAMNQWQANIYTSTFFDQNGNGVRDSGETGLTLVPTNIRFRDGSYSNFNNTDLDRQRRLQRGLPAVQLVRGRDRLDCATRTPAPTWSTTPAVRLTARSAAPRKPRPRHPAGTLPSARTWPIPPSRSRCPRSCGCRARAIACTRTAPRETRDLLPGRLPRSTGRVDPPWVMSEGWQGFSGQNSSSSSARSRIVRRRERRHSRRGDLRLDAALRRSGAADPTSWDPGRAEGDDQPVPGGYRGRWHDQSLKLVDTTTTTSWDDWAQGFRSDGVPNMNCPGQATDATCSSSRC